MSSANAFPLAPGRLPLIGHAHRILRDLPGFMRDCRERHGDFFRVELLGQQLVVVGSEIAYELFQNKQVSSEILEETGPILEGTLMAMDGPRHRRLRKAMAGPFTRAHLDTSRVGELIAEETRPLVDAWVGAESCAFARDVRQLGLNVIFRLIGVEPGNLDAWTRQYAHLMAARARLPGPFAWQSRRAQRWIDAEVEAILVRCRAAGTRDTLVGALALGEDEEGELVDLGELVPSVRLLVLAGHETSASSIGWSLLALADHPEAWDRLVREAAGAERAPRTPSELDALPFTVAFAREIMRLYTPATIMMRRTTEPIELGGRVVEAGQGLMFPLYLINRDPNVFPEPDALRPERWLAADAPKGPHQIAPFGGGPHTCLGLHLAQLEVAHVLVAVARAMGERRLRPSRRGKPLPRGTWFPAAQIPDRTRLWWEA